MMIDPAMPRPLEKKKNMPVNAMLGLRFQSRIRCKPPRSGLRSGGRATMPLIRWKSSSL